MLKYLKNLPAPTDKTLFVVGNQSADMDSCCCALVVSYIFKDPQFASIQPYIDVPKSDLKLRPDISWLFAQLEIPLDKIRFKDEPLDKNAHLFLVDHNSPSVEGQVYAIIDHHQPEGEELEVPGPHILGTTGSCMSLVIDHFKSSEGWNDGTVATLGMAPIMQDTRNLTQKDKTTETDIKSYQFVEQYFPFTINTTADELKNFKKDLTGFSAMDVLKKDYKQWGGIGISSLPLLFDELESQWPDFTSALAEFKQEKSLKEYVALTSGKKNKVYTREFIIVGNNLDVENTLPELGLTLLTKKGDIYVFEEADSTANRKVVAPLLRKISDA